MKQLFEILLVIAGVIIFVFWAIVQLASEAKK